MRQPWLYLEPAGLVRPAKPPRLDPVDLILGRAVRATEQVSRAALIDLSGMATPTAQRRPPVTHALYLDQVFRGQYRVIR